MKSVLALDGEGISRTDGSHDYTLLLAYDGHPSFQRPYYIEDVRGRLSSGYIFRFLTHLRWGGRIVCGYYLNYDVAKWIQDLSDQDKTTLWQSGWVVWRDGSYGSERTCYYLRYIPSKLFFVGEWDPDVDIGQASYEQWPRRHLLIYDVSGFFQCSFVQALREWRRSIGISTQELNWIQHHKKQRSSFTVESAEDTRRYCARECYWLARLVGKLQETLIQEGVIVHGWYGAGAVGSFYLRREQVGTLLSDAAGLSGEAAGRLQVALRTSYFGGRNEICRMGRLFDVLDYDVHSAYPAACLEIPDLASGWWEEVREYDPSADFAVWHVSWDFRDQCLSLGPFPFRRKHGVYYPDAGSGWYHAVEVRAALRYYTDGRGVGGLQRACAVDRGWIYHPGSAVRPFDFLSEIAAKRLFYKRAGDPRQVPYKFTLNSMYGKLAQHTTDVDRQPPYQSYAAAGFVTARTRSRLLDFVFQYGDPSYRLSAGPEGDVVMIATDGLFCTRERTQGLGTDLGSWDEPEVMRDGYIIQPGVWYGVDGIQRTRGFFAHSLDYQAIQSAWRRMGVYAFLPFHETRFVGLGMSAGRGNYTDFGRWVPVERDLQFYPERKYPGARDGESLRLIPRHFAGEESEPFAPPATQDASLAWESVHSLDITLMLLDQPDIGG